MYVCQRGIFPQCRATAGVQYRMNSSLTVMKSKWGRGGRGWKGGIKSSAKWKPKVIYLRSEVVIVQFVIFIMYRSGPGTQAWMGTMGISRTQSFGLCGVCLSLQSEIQTLTQLFINQGGHCQAKMSTYSNWRFWKNDDNQTTQTKKKDLNVRLLKHSTR